MKETLLEAYEKKVSENSIRNFPGPLLWSINRA